MSRSWTVLSKKEPSIFLKIELKHRELISSKFPKTFRGADDFVMFYDFFSWLGFFSDFKKKSRITTKSPVPLKLFQN